MVLRTVISLALFFMSVQQVHAARVTLDPGHSPASPGAIGCSASAGIDGVTSIELMITQPYYLRNMRRMPGLPLILEIITGLSE